jgi:hypothetical protein
VLSWVPDVVCTPALSTIKVVESFVVKHFATLSLTDLSGTAHINLYIVRCL